MKLRVVGKPYDNNGNTLTKTDSTGTTNYAWDFENRLTGVTLPGSGGTVSFKYDPFGRRVYKSSSSGTSVYAYDGDNLIEEANSSGAVIARYSATLRVDDSLAMLRSGTTSFYQFDGLGSATSLTNSSGNVTDTYAFDSFGNSTASTGATVNPFRYTAREFDTETNLYFYRARYYDQASGRFLREDPLRFAAGGGNFYAYAHNTPTRLRDPLGLCPASCPNYIKNFFDTLLPIFKDMADETGTDMKYFAALAAYESGWLGQHAQDLQNPFGLTNAGGNDLNFKSYADAQDYWMYKAGRTGDGYADVIQGAGSISEFAQALKNAGYNNKTGTWAKDVINQLKSINKWMGICNITQ